LPLFNRKTTQFSPKTDKKRPSKADFHKTKAKTCLAYFVEREQLTKRPLRPQSLPRLKKIGQLSIVLSDLTLIGDRNQLNAQRGKQYTYSITDMLQSKDAPQLKTTAHSAVSWGERQPTSVGFLLFNGDGQRLN
jgi:hypothetical protein